MTSLQITKLVFSPLIFYPWQCYTNLMTFCFSVKSLKKPTTAFYILDYVSFCSNSTRSASFTKLVNKSARTNTINHSYFYRLPRLWNSLPLLIFLLVSTLLKGPSSNSSGITLSIILIHVIIVHFIIYVRVISV